MLINLCSCCSFVKWPVAQYTSSCLICQKQDVRAWTGLSWLRTDPNGELFLYGSKPLGFINLGWNSWTDFRILVSPKGNFLHVTNIGLNLGVGFGGGSNVVYFCSPPSYLCDLLTAWWVRYWHRAQWLWPGCSQQQLEHSWTRTGGQVTVYLRSENLGFRYMTSCRFFGYLFPWTWRLYSPTCRTVWHTDTTSCPGRPESTSIDAVTCSAFIPNIFPDTCMHLGHLNTTLQFSPSSRNQSWTAIPTYTLRWNVGNLDKCIYVVWDRWAAVMVVNLLNLLHTA